MRISNTFENHRVSTKTLEHNKIYHNKFILIIFVLEIYILKVIYNKNYSSAPRYQLVNHIIVKIHNNYKFYFK
jgi:hypothetical protein